MNFILHNILFFKTHPYNISYESIQYMKSKQML